MPNVNPLKEKEQQDEDFARFQAKAERRGDNADAVMSNYWRADEDLNEDERFLRDYVMNRQWLETDSLSPGIWKIMKVWCIDKSESVCESVCSIDVFCFCFFFKCDRHEDVLTVDVLFSLSLHIYIYIYSVSFVFKYYVNPQAAP